VCRNCLRRELGCTFDSPGSSRIAIRNLLSFPPPDRAPHRAHAVFCQLLDSIPRPLALASQGLDMDNLELLHHFTTSTYATLSSSADINELWKTAVPRLAIKNEFLMHALLSTSALHISSLRDADAAYRLAAERHHDKALISLQAALSEFPERVGNALFAASCLVVIYAFACQTSTSNHSLTAVTWIPLTRGISAIIASSQTIVAEGELAPLLHELLGRDSDEERPELPQSALLLVTGDAPDPEELLDPGVADVYTAAVDTLREAWDTFWGTTARIAAAFTWPTRMPEEFVRYLEEQRPRALVILSYHCSMLTALDSFWWIKGRPADEIARIEALLGDEWRKGWLAWPIKRIRD